MGRAVAALVVTLALVHVHVVVVAAQESDEERARRHFMEAQEAFDAGRLGDARESLLRSLELSRRPATALNLARVEDRRGALVAAKRVLEDLLAGRYGDTSDAISAPARTLLEEVTARIAHVVIRVVDQRSELQVELDGAPAGVIEVGGSADLELDIAEHYVVVRAEDGRRVSRRLRPSEGERIELELVLPNVAEDDDEGIGVTTAASRSAGPCVLLGGGAAALVTGVVLVGLVQRDINDIENPGAPDGSDPVWPDFEDRHDSTGLRSGIGFALAGVGAALMIAGVVWRATEDVDVAVTASAVNVRGSF